MLVCSPHVSLPFDGGHKNERANERVAAVVAATAFHLFFMLMIKLRQETDVQKQEEVFKQDAATRAPHFINIFIPIRCSGISPLS